MNQSPGRIAIRLGRSFAKVVYQRPGGGNGLGMRSQAEAFEAGDAELFGEQALAVGGTKNPLFEAGFGGLPRGIGRSLRPRRARGGGKPPLGGDGEVSRRGGML